MYDMSNLMGLNYEPLDIDICSELKPVVDQQ